VWIGQIKYDDGNLIPIASAGSVLEHIPIVPVDCTMPDQPIACQALCREEAIFEAAVGANGHPGSEAAIPLQMGSETTAVLVLSSPVENYFTDSRQSQILAFANQAGLALQSARFYEEAKKTQHRLEELSRRLVQIQEEERRVIAQELHDEIGQMLTGLKLLIETGATQPEKLKDARSLINDLIGQVRQMSLDLRPAMLDDLGLLPALAWLINRYTHQTGIKVEFIHSGLENRRFSDEIEITAYRVVQESLTNVARYAQVETANLHIWTTPTDLMVQISDRGIGFDFENTIKHKEGRGLLGMRERVNFVGGNLFIESKPNQGTTIIAKLTLPLEKGV